MGLTCEGKSRGYAFIEFEHKKDMKEAYKQTAARLREEGLSWTSSAEGLWRTGKYYK
jgi:hypothetical protein